MLEMQDKRQTKNADITKTKYNQEKANNTNTAEWSGSKVDL